MGRYYIAGTLETYIPLHGLNGHIFYCRNFMGRYSFAWTLWTHSIAGTLRADILLQEHYGQIFYCRNIMGRYSIA